MWQMASSCFPEHIGHSVPKYIGQIDVPPGFVRPACLQCGYVAENRQGMESELFIAVRLVAYELLKRDSPQYSSLEQSSEPH